MGHENSFFELETLEVVEPCGQPVLESKFGEPPGSGQLDGADALLGNEDDDTSVGQTDALPEVAEEHQASERRGQSRDEQSVIPASDGTGNRPRRVASEAIGDEPFRLQEL